MAYENRGSGQYYYRKRREGKRVVSEYVGGGLIGTLASGRDMEERHKRNIQHAELMQQKKNAAKIDERINEVEKFTQAMTRAALLLAGYHAPRRQWRKRRNG